MSDTMKALAFLGSGKVGLVERDILNTRATVTKVLTGAEVLEDPRFLEPRHQNFRLLIMVFSSLGGDASLPMVVELEGLGQTGYRLGTSVTMLTGAAWGSNSMGIGVGNGAELAPLIPLPPMRIVQCPPQATSPVASRTVG